MREKAKKALWYGLVVIAAPLVLLGAPSLSPAEAFSLSSFISRATSANPDLAPLSYNSQTMPLLASAINLDPNIAKGGGDISVVGGDALEPQSGPQGTAADISEWPTSSQVSVYTVRAGDSLGGIAKMFGVSVNTIVWANDIQKGVIHEGETLVILPITGVRHTVAKGDTLASLAKRYKADPDEIAQFNGLDANSPLAVGSSILIPNGEVAAGGVQHGTSVGSGSSKSKSKSKHKIGPEPYLGGGGPDYDSYYSWPVDGGAVTQGLHGWNAVDIGASRGTPIVASADGIVIVAKTGGWNGGYGNYIVIQHDNGTQTLYGHASKILVSAGDSVSQGQTIALVGTTGLSTGPHLHFEVRGAKNPFADVAVGGSE